MSKAKTPAKAQNPAEVIAELGLDKAAPAKVKPSEKPENVTNERNIKWPQDKSGMTGGLRREGARSIGRMAGKEENLRLVLDTLKVLADYAEAKLAWQKAQKLSVADSAAARKAANDAAVMNTKRRQAAAARAKIKALEAEAEALEAKVK